MRRSSTAVAFAGGVLLATVSLWLRAVARGDSFLAQTVPASGTEAASLVVIVAGVILLGAIPVLLALEASIYAPILALVGLFVWAHYRSWHALEYVREEGAATIGIYPDAIFGVFWLLTLGIVLVVGGLEYIVLDRLLGIHPRRNDATS